MIEPRTPEIEPTPSNAATPDRADGESLPTPIPAEDGATGQCAELAGSTGAIGWPRIGRAYSTAEIRALLSRIPPRVRWDAGFLGGVLLLIVLTAQLLSAAGGSLTQPAGASLPTAGPATVRPADVRRYAFASPDVGPMLPAVDAQGNVWVGEMATNHLTRINAKTGRVSSWTPPGGQYNIMTTAVDSQGRVWFTEQIANYIGRFDPATGQFATYPLGSANGHGMGPQDLKIDQAGALWFTCESGGRIGRLDPETGAIRTWTIPAPALGVNPYPFALTLTPAGQVWFGLLDGGAVGRLDPASGQVSLFHLANSHAAVFSMASDARGRVFFTELQTGKLGVIDSASGRVRELDIPRVLGDPASVYGLVVLGNGDVWFASAGANALVRFAPTGGAFTFYQLPIASSIPYGLTLDGSGAIWFTASATSANYVGVLSSGA